MKLKQIVDAVHALEIIKAKQIGSSLSAEEWMLCMECAIELRHELNKILLRAPEVQIET